jgi:hypothetical protein
LNILYETPNEEYRIVSFVYDGWKDVFGDLDGIYVFKKVQPKDKNLQVFRQENSVADCLLWLRKQGVISKDELEAQLKLLCPSK